MSRMTCSGMMLVSATAPTSYRTALRHHRLQSSFSPLPCPVPHSPLSPPCITHITHFSQKISKQSITQRRRDHMLNKEKNMGKIMEMYVCGPVQRRVKWTTIMPTTEIKKHSHPHGTEKQATLVHTTSMAEANSGHRGFRPFFSLFCHFTHRFYIDISLHRPKTI